MTSSGWAIWKNQPKRYKKNLTGNRFNKDSNSGIFNISKTSPNYTHFSEDNNEFIWHLSPFKTLIDPNLWAPSSAENCIKRSNFTIRRTNYNLFRYLRDLFDDNSVLKDFARNTINDFERYLRIYYKDLNDTETDRDIILLNKLYLKLSNLIRISDSSQTNSKLENTKVARILYYNFKNKPGKFQISNSLEMLYNFIEALEDTLSNEVKRKIVLEKYTLGEDQITPNEEYRNYLKKYLKYKQKYIELKNKLPNN
jgi:hypothetical protein